MTKWRKVHIDDKEWLWTIAKMRDHVVIKYDGKYRRILCKEISPHTEITPGRVKQYIVEKIISKLIHAKKKTGPNLIRGEVKYDPRVILPCVMPSSKNKHRMVIDGDLIKVSSDRLYTFKKSLTCAKCGIIGRFLVKEKTPKDRSYHLNLYAEKDGREVLMTKDHIVPKSLGGKDRLDNYQTMCVECNLMKGNET